MAKYNLKKIYDEKSLNFFRQKSEKVEKIDEEILQLIDSMYGVLYSNNAIGLAALMIGVPKRIIIVDLQENNIKRPITLINPELIEHSEEISEGEEASISLDNVKSLVPRYKNIKVKYFDKDFNEKILEANGLLSVCIQHELDYLDGKLFIDYLKDEEKNSIINKIKSSLRVTNIVEDVEILRTKCEDVLDIDKNIISTLDKMLETMYNNRGIGLAGNQIGLNKKLVVIDLQENNEKNPIFLINPKILWKSDEKVKGEEGCLSIPGNNVRAEVERSKAVKVEYLDKSEKKQIIETDGLLAICLQHEIDHLNGVVYIDYLSKLKRDNIINKVKKELKNR